VYSAISSSVNVSLNPSNCWYSSVWGNSNALISSISEVSLLHPASNRLSINKVVKSQIFFVYIK
jgi:ATP-dependent helicase YprA (DUF1998 family)